MHCEDAAHGALKCNTRNSKIRRANKWEDKKGEYKI